MTSFKGNWTDLGLPKVKNIMGCAGLLGVRPCNVSGQLYKLTVLDSTNVIRLFGKFLERNIPRMNLGPIHCTPTALISSWDLSSKECLARPLKSSCRSMCLILRACTVLLHKDTQILVTRQTGFI